VKVRDARNLDEDTLLDIDADGKICGNTVQQRIEDIPPSSRSLSRLRVSDGLNLDESAD
jgi:uncharacterized protein YuzE